MRPKTVKIASTTFAILLGALAALPFLAFAQTAAPASSIDPNQLVTITCTLGTNLWSIYDTTGAAVSTGNGCQGYGGGDNTINGGVVTYTFTVNGNYTLVECNILTDDGSCQNALTLSLAEASPYIVGTGTFVFGIPPGDESVNIVAAFPTLTNSVADILTYNTGLILAILAGLIGLGILVRYVMRWIGKK